ncbi:tripartite tricarboxylate transporter TctB family protein [Hydrogenophaga sp. BPS33]|uniref:tripartite tricarboxylate transporter TctB family protein n=1 Tax=Hydrogenophaga sp. BPS33 TaxID=2651974 RepID=UPI00131FB292|nr:tripartite tricarboxylate transporter TctB family protein [Hydrogenophaga sp. BPS33]QHE86801.1 tripartite tricarboxylate transporter TctB family protein [Hydrogenophaga sp. BPS33]
MNNDASRSANLHRPGQLAMGVGALLVAAVLAFGAAAIPSDAGYAGVGPNFLPWVVSAALAVCGVMLIREVLTGGYRQMEEPSGSARGDWRALAWVLAGVLLNAALITTIGFILSCALCFVLAVRGLRMSEGRRAGDAMQTLKDAVTGMLIAAPVFWLFTKVLAVNLPGVTASGWI